MYDEFYVKCNNGAIPGNQYYTDMQGTSVSFISKYFSIEKFGNEGLIWQEICTCREKTGVFVTYTNLNKDIYLNKECLKNRLLPFII